MRIQFGKTFAVCALAIVCLASAMKSQPPAPAAQAAPPAAVSTVVASPTYISIPLEIAVNRPAVDVWKRIGKYCDIGEWLRIPCTITRSEEHTSELQSRSD